MGKRLNQMSNKWSQQDVAPPKATTLSKNSTTNEDEIVAKRRAAKEALAREEADLTNKEMDVASKAQIRAERSLSKGRNANSQDKVPSNTS